MKSTFKVLFYLKKGNEKSNGNLPLMCRITVEARLSIGCKIDIPLQLLMDYTRLQRIFNLISLSLSLSHKIRPDRYSLLLHVSGRNCYRLHPLGCSAYMCC